MVRATPPFRLVRITAFSATPRPLAARYNARGKLTRRVGARIRSERPLPRGEGLTSRRELRRGVKVLQPRHDQLHALHVLLFGDLKLDSVLSGP